MKLKTKTEVIESLTKNTYGEFKEVLNGALSIAYEYGQLHASMEFKGVLEKVDLETRFKEIRKRAEQIAAQEKRRKS